MCAMRLRFTGVVLWILALALIPAVAGAAVQVGPVTNPSNGHQYYLLTPNSWTGAEAEAVSLGGHLVTINDAAENAWVWGTFSGHGPLWIGLSDAAQEGTFVWTSGEPATYFNWWGPPTGNEPNGGTTENYVEMNNAVWNDNQNGGPFYAVVEVGQTTIFNATFDTDVPGALPNLVPAGDPPGDSIALIDENTSFSHITVQAPAAPGAAGFPTNSLLFEKQASTGNSPIFRAVPDPAFGPYTTGIYTVTWSSLSRQGNGNYGFAALVVPGVASAFTVNYSATGRILYQDNNVGITGAVDTGVSYSVNVPQVFRAVVDLDQRVFDLYIDGVQVASQRGFQNNSFDRVGAFHWEIGGIDAESYAVDSISIVMNGGISPLPDQDGDGIPDGNDNCPADHNPRQEDGDGDGVGDLCDNCPVIANSSQEDVCSTQYLGRVDKLTTAIPKPGDPILVSGCFLFDSSTDKDYVFKPTCANTVWEVTDANQDVLAATGCVNGPAQGIPDDLVPIRDAAGAPITYCTEPCNLLDRFQPEVLTPLFGGTATFEAAATFTTLIQCPAGESIPGLDSGDVCPGILMASVKSLPVTITVRNPIAVRIDIKPGVSPNVINLGSNGNVPVAIFGSATFNAADVDPASVKMADASVKIRGKGTYMTSLSDLNADGFPDLIVHIDTQGLAISANASNVFVNGNTYGGVWFEGTDSVRVLPE